MYSIKEKAVTYDHRLRRTGDPVRSRILKPQIGRLVVGWVTTSEYLLLYVFWRFYFASEKYSNRPFVRDSMLQDDYRAGLLSILLYDYASQLFLDPLF
jgi:hypothetical protein